MNQQKNEMNHYLRLVIKQIDMPRQNCSYLFMFIGRRQCDQILASYKRSTRKSRFLSRSQSLLIINLSITFFQFLYLAHLLPTDPFIANSPPYLTRYRWFCRFLLNGFDFSARSQRIYGNLFKFFVVVAFLRFVSTAENIETCWKCFRVSMWTDR